MRGFSYGDYEAIITQVKNNFEIVSFSRAIELDRQGENSFAVIRHDVDFSLGKALNMAKVDADNGVSSTFCFLPWSSNYSLANDRWVVNELLRLGHDIGLHLDLSCLGHFTPEERIKNDCAYLSALFGTRVRVISVHFLGRVSAPPKCGEEIICTWQEPFMQSIKYFSDSTGAWRYGNPVDSDEYKHGRPLHLNFHPIWWGSISEQERIEILRRIGSHEFKKIAKAYGGI